MSKSNEGKLSITTHILDTSRGLPANGLPVCLYKFKDNMWNLLKESVTDSNGRCMDLLQNEQEYCGPGRYKIEFRKPESLRDSYRNRILLPLGLVRRPRV
ncbi:hypothetical protein P5V15_012274 [Pogonomyrmex californicus]